MWLENHTNTHTLLLYLCEHDKYVFYAVSHFFIEPSFTSFFFHVCEFAYLRTLDKNIWKF